MKKICFYVFRGWLFMLMMVNLSIFKNAYGYLGEFNFTSYWMAQDLARRQQELGQLRKETKKWEAIQNGSAIKGNDKNKKEKAIIGDFYFNYNPEISSLSRQQAINAIIELGRATGTMNAEKENLLNKAFGNIDIMQTIGAALQKKGHSPHSLATAVGYWLVSHLQVAQDTDFTDRQLAAVVKQVERQLRKTKMPDDDEKQMAAEHLLWTATFQLLSYQDVRNTGSKQEQKAIAELSRTMLRQQFGMDADKMTITDKGLVSQ